MLSAFSTDDSEVSCSFANNIRVAKGHNFSEFNPKYLILLFWTIEMVCSKNQAWFSKW